MLFFLRKEGGMLLEVLSRYLVKKNAYVLKNFKNEDIKPAISNTMFDAMFFNSNYGRKYTSYLISLVLDMDYQYVYDNISFVNAGLNRLNLKEKKMTVDLVCLVKEKVINVEMNGKSTTKRKLYRNINYLDRLYGQKSMVGNKYEYNDVTQISINNFYFKDKNNINSTVVLQMDGETYTNKKKIIHIFVPLIRKKWYDGNERLTKLEKFILAINESSSDKLDELIKEDEIMKEYRTDAKMMSLEDNILGLYDKEAEDEWLREGEEYDREQERKAYEEEKKIHEIERKNYEAEKKNYEAEIKKLKQNKIDIARNMINSKLDLNIVESCTGLSKQVLMKLI